MSDATKSDHPANQASTTTGTTRDPKTAAGKTPPATTNSQAPGGLAKY